MMFLPVVKQSLAASGYYYQGRLFVEACYIGCCKLAYIIHFVKGKGKENN